MPDPLLGASQPLCPPLYQSSVYTLPDLDALDRVVTGDAPGFIYARDGHPNARRLAERLAALEGASWAVVCGSGMAAVTATVLSCTNGGDRVVASDRLYGRTTQLLGQELVRFGLKTDFVDVADLDAVRRALREPARLLFVETLSNPLLRVADLDQLAELAHARDCALVVDNTFATPILTRPLERAADLVIESLTKMIGGHSDVTLGVTCGRGEEFNAVNQVSTIWGLAANPFDCWLAERGLATLGLRMRAACANAAALAGWLAERRSVRRVVYPGRADHPEHGLAAQILGGLFGNMLCFELEGGRAAANQFMRRARGIPFSPSLGDVATTCSHPGGTSHRYVAAADKERQGIGDGLIRLSVGIEDLAVIQQELSRGLP